MSIQPAWQLRSSDPDFDRQFQALVNLDRDQGSHVTQLVKDLIAEVRRDGDAALYAATAKFDRLDLTNVGLQISVKTRDALAAEVPADAQSALEVAADRIRRFHERQKPQDLAYEDALGLHLGYRWTAVDRAGIYVPGGRAAYPSSLLMAAIPARVAGVGELVMVVPTPHGVIAPLVMAAAKLAGIKEIYRIGGAQAIAALAYGTDSLRPVDVIVGPGNAYVAEAKRQVFGQVGIDMIAGPSEILIIADGQQNPAWIAADLVSQCEHDPNAQAILISPDRAFLRTVRDGVCDQLAALPEAATARASWVQHGALIEARNLSQAAVLSDRLAPEHLELAVQDPQALFAQLRHAGCVFLGAHTPEPLGDYLAGPSHILPTRGTARFSSGLAVQTFMKRTTFLDAGSKALACLGPAIQILAKAEGLPAHAQAIAVRNNQA